MSLCNAHNCKHTKKFNCCSYHRFPLDEKICKEWVRRLGDDDLLSFTPQLLHASRFVCSCHFTVDDYASSKKTRLRGSAVPSIFTEGLISLSDKSMEYFPPQSFVVESSTAVEVSVTENEWTKSITTKKSNSNHTSKNADTAESPIQAIDDIESSQMENVEPRIENDTPKRKRRRSSELTHPICKKVYLLPYQAKNPTNSLNHVDLQQVIIKKHQLSTVPSHQMLLKELEGYLKHMKPSPAQEVAFKIDSLLMSYCKPINFRRVS